MALPGPGSLNELFQRITTDEALKQYEPTIVSMPNPTADGIKDGPWIVTFDSFLTDEECDTLIDIGAKEGYMDSINFIADKAGGARTSKHTWCKDQCIADNEVARRVDDRIQQMTGIPVANSEHVQLLKYDVGEFYREHNDYNPAHQKVQTGVRILTVFLYLNDVEAGGETQFPNLDYAVKPKKGKVVIWPSVLNEDPNSQDDRTLHQALPVEKGLKYGANVWIHQREYRESYNKGCTYSPK
jgi:prolyl 4-hydroxylase